MTVAATLTAQAQRWRAHRLFPAFAIAGLAIALLLGAYAFQFIGGLKPCPLCLEQRAPWMFLIVVAGAVIAADRVQLGRTVHLAIYGLAFAIAAYGAYLGLYHAGIEYGWWPGPPTCTGAGEALEPSGNLLDDIAKGGVVMCDRAAWTLAGISLAGFNFFFSLIAVGLAGIGFATTVKEH